MNKKNTGERGNQGQKKCAIFFHLSLKNLSLDLNIKAVNLCF